MAFHIYLLSFLLLVFFCYCYLTPKENTNKRKEKKKAIMDTFENKIVFGPGLNIYPSRSAGPTKVTLTNKDFGIILSVTNC